MVQCFFFGWGWLFLDKANNTVQSSRLETSSWQVGVGSDGSNRGGSGAKALSLLPLRPGDSLMSSINAGEVSCWFRAWVAVRGLSTGVIVLSWRVSGRLPLRRTRRSKRGSDVGFLDILVMCKGE